MTLVFLLLSCEQTDCSLFSIIFSKMFALQSWRIATMSSFKTRSRHAQWSLPKIQVTLMAESEEELKSLLKVKEESEKVA